jgi:hypothetical protein
VSCTRDSPRRPSSRGRAAIDGGACSAQAATGRDGSARAPHGAAGPGRSTSASKVKPHLPEH